jgi:hypothetical protein
VGVPRFGLRNTHHETGSINEGHRNSRQLTLLEEIKSARLSQGGHGNCNKDRDVDGGAGEESAMIEAARQILPSSATAATVIQVKSWVRIKESISDQ